MTAIDPGLKITADRIISTARCAHRDFWFGDRKVFLAAVLPDDADERAAMLATLDSCRRAQLLTFARADLVAAMDPDLVDESEWNLGGAQYHFLVVA